MAAMRRIAELILGWNQPVLIAVPGHEENLWHLKMMRCGATALVAARLPHRDIARNLKFARM
jgi:hypothetical protein